MQDSCDVHEFSTSRPEHTYFNDGRLLNLQQLRSGKSN